MLPLLRRGTTQGTVGDEDKGDDEEEKRGEESDRALHDREHPIVAVLGRDKDGKH